MLRKVVLFLLTALFVAIPALAQLTVTVPTEFKVKKFIKSKNTIGTPIESVYCPLDIDAVPIFGIHGTVIDTFYVNGYRAVVKLQHSKFSPSGSVTESYVTTDTLPHGTEIMLPYE